MGQEAIDRILEEKRRSAPPEDQETGQADKFFLVLGADGIEEEFLEFQLSNGNLTCFSYGDLNWFNYDPKAGCIDLEFGSALVTIKGRGLVPKLWSGIKRKRVAWIKERDSEMQDHKENECFVESITITPASFENEGGEESPE